jgi:hypothetical protein
MIELNDKTKEVHHTFWKDLKIVLWRNKIGFMRDPMHA